MSRDPCSASTKTPDTRISTEIVSCRKTAQRKFKTMKSRYEDPSYQDWLMLLLMKTDCCYKKPRRAKLFKLSELPRQTDLPKRPSAFLERTEPTPSSIRGSDRQLQGWRRDYWSDQLIRSNMKIQAIPKVEHLHFPPVDPNQLLKDLYWWSYFQTQKINRLSSRPPHPALGDTTFHFCSCNTISKHSFCKA